MSWNSQSFPKVQLELKWASKEVRWDIYEAGWKEKNWKYPPVVGENGYIGAATTSIYAGGWAFDEGSMDRDLVLPMPDVNVFRNTGWNWYEHSYWWLGKLANGSYIAPGNYS